MLKKYVFQCGRSDDHFHAEPFHEEIGWPDGSKMALPAYCEFNEIDSLNFENSASWLIKIIFSNPNGYPYSAHMSKILQIENSTYLLSFHDIDEWSTGDEIVRDKFPSVVDYFIDDFMPKLGRKQLLNLMKELKDSQEPYFHGYVQIPNSINSIYDELEVSVSLPKGIGPLHEIF